MAQTPTTIAKKLYVTVQYRGDTNNTDGLLGFASPYTKDAAFEKRKSTQDSWAYGGAKVAIDEEDQVTVTGSGQRAYGGGQAWDASMLFIAGCYPRIIDNEPVEGFEIAKSVRRYGWNGGGNVKWRITDPRGFDLEISSENFASVLSCSTMVNGVIQGKCVWGRQGSNNILLPETSEPFLAATAMTTKVNTKISLKDVNPGDKVEILSTKVLDKNKVCYYMGKYFFLQADEREDTSSSSRYGYGTGEHRFDQKQTEKYLFKSANGGDYFTLASPKIVAILDKIPTPVNKLEVAKTVTAELSRTVDIDDVDKVILLSPTKIDLTKITTSRVPLNETFQEGSTWPKVGYYADHIYCEYDGKTYLSKNGSGSYNNATRQYDYSASLLEVTDRLAENKLDARYTMNQGSGGYWNRGPQREDIIRSDFKFADLKMFRIVVTDGTTGITGKVFKV
jgi:hypothetical protein